MLHNQLLGAGLLRHQLWVLSVKVKAIGLAGFFYSRVENNYKYFIWSTIPCYLILVMKAHF